MSHAEQMVAADGSVRASYLRGSKEFDEQVQLLIDRFGPLNTNTWALISAPHFNNIYDDDVVSVVFYVKPAYMDIIDASAVGRKYFLNRGWVYDKVYTFTTRSTCQLPFPLGSLPMFIGKLVNVYGQPGDEDLSRYQCLYFTHQDHKEVERWSGHSLPQGGYSTSYAATFDVESGNRLLRIKNYVYDEQNDISDLDVAWLQIAKQRGVLEESLPE